MDGWHLASGAVDLFGDEWKLPLIDTTFAAYVSAIAEHLFLGLPVIGLATRFSAFALPIMTLVIESFVYPNPGRRMAFGWPAFWC